MQSMSALRTGVATPRHAAWRPFAAPPLLRRQRRSAQLRRLATSASAVEGSQLTRLAGESGGKLYKTAVGKLSVAELRAECERFQLPSEGLKAVLVERLLGWWEEQGKEPKAGGAPVTTGSVQDEAATSSAAAPAELATAAPAAAAATQPAATLAAAQAAPAAAAAAIGDGAVVGAQQAQQAQQQAPQRRQRTGPGGPVSVTWLGTSSGSPTPRRNVSSISVQFDQDIYLVDSGEGTRNQLRKTKMDPARIRAIFVTHMHGDHCFGVGGVISAVCEARKGTPQQNEPLLVWGPPELQPLVLAGVRTGNIVLTSPLVVTGWVLDPERARGPTAVDPDGLLQMALQAPDQAERVPPQMAKGWQTTYDQGSDDVVQVGLTWSVRIPGAPLVQAAQLQHRVPCWGYVFQEPSAAVLPPRRAAPAAAANGAGEQAADAAAEAAPGAGHQPEQAAEQAGAGGPEQGGPPQWVQRGRKLVILGDTCDSTAIAPLALGCDLLSHEATFCSGMEEKAAIAQHSTTLQAGAFAAAVEAQRLVLTHFSARYETTNAASPGFRRGGAHQRGGRGGGRDREARGEGGGMAAMMDDLKGSELERLVEETYSTYRKESLDLAHDFFTVDVALPPPMPAAQLEAQQAQQATAASAAAAAAKEYAWRRPGGGNYTTQRRPSGQQQQQYQQRRPGGQQQYQQRGGDGQYQQRGGEGQYQQRGGEGQYQQRQGGDGQYQQRRQQRPAGAPAGQW